MKQHFLTKPCLLAFTSLSLLASAAAFAQPAGGGGGPGGERPNGPPPEAIAACSNLASGAACSFTGRRNEKLTGTCFAPPARPANAASSASQSTPALACRPAGGPEGGPPPQR